MRNDTASQLAVVPERTVITVVLPCLNEIETLGICVKKAQAAIRELGVPGEVVVADNGSTDGSAELAASLGARVVSVREKGYGNALRAGISAAEGDYIVMGDADDSYDFSRLGPFYRELRAGADLVIGNRFRGGILPGAMPWKHKWIGNPVLTFIGQLFFRTPVGDFHCGLRAFTRDAFQRMDLRTTGMEFASEMVARAAMLGMKVTEVPIVLHKDGRSRPPHLRSWRDGWRHLRFMLLLSPLWLFTVPGLLLFLLGVTGCAWLLPYGRRLGAIEVDIHSLLVLATVAIVGYQVAAFGVVAKQFAVTAGLHPPSRAMARFARPWLLETGILTGSALLLGGAALIAVTALRWSSGGFGNLNPGQTMRAVIPGTLLMGIGIQTVFSAFLFHLIGSTRPPR